MIVVLPPPFRPMRQTSFAGVDIQRGTLDDVVFALEGVDIFNFEHCRRSVILERTRAGRSSE
jgi:hypothetical protein